MKILHKFSTILAGTGLVFVISQTAFGHAAGQEFSANIAVEPAAFETQLTFRSHNIGPGSSAGNLEGAACPADHKMLSGACHPSYNDKMIIINQFPNLARNTWRCGFKNNTGSSKTVYIYTLCGRSSVPDNVVQHRLQIRRFTSSSLTNTEADRILADATTVLQNNDGVGDVACQVAFSRDDDVTVFTDGDGSIDSSAEFSALIGLPGHIKVVNQINWCGGLIPNVIGCAPVPGNSMAVVRFTPSLEGILWAHELGHNKGLSHRNDDPNAVMNGTIASSRLRVNSAECNAFKSLAAKPPEPEMVVMAQAQETPAMSVEDFVRQVFIHGVPYEEASKYGPSDVPVLLKILNDPAEKAFWSNTVVVLGMIADESAVAPLIAFIEAGDERGLSQAHYQAKTSALMSLGYLINKSGNQQALNFLKEKLNPETWAKSGVGIAPFQKSTTERDFDFSKHVILGLALSGHPEAEEALRSLQKPAETEVGRAFQAQQGGLVVDALKEHGKIAKQGLADYYRATKP